MKIKTINSKIFTIEEFLSSEECKEFIDLTENIGYEIATINTFSGARVDTSVRNNTRVLYKSFDIAEKLWNKSKKHVPSTLAGRKACGLNELFRFYRYEKGQEFKGHLDGSFVRNPDECSYLTFMIYLNDDFKGGTTTFQDIEIIPKKGMALIFQHRQYHAGTEVSEGRKYVLRSDVMYRKKSNNQS